MKIDDLPLMPSQRDELESDLAGNAGNVEIARKVTAWGHPISEAAVRRYREAIGSQDTDRRRVLGSHAGTALHTSAASRAHAARVTARPRTGGWRTDSGTTIRRCAGAT